ncbi:hypothetical protein [Streptomyces erythrochromogenes]|uniref:hypothetical protein n=1 Tax=Streptomyces erythrochromogenes TaxID=285574 RepID=UPI0036A702CD
MRPLSLAPANRSAPPPVHRFLRQYVLQIPVERQPGHAARLRRIEAILDKAAAQAGLPYRAA